MADSTLIDFVTTADNSQKSLDGYKAHLKETAKSTSALSTITTGAGKVMKIFAATAVNALASIVVAKIINEVIEAYDNWVHRIDNAKDAMEKSKESYNEVTDELGELKEQAFESRTRMNELEKAGLVNDDEYKKLQETNAELEREIKLLEARQKVTATEAWDTAEDWYDKTRRHSASGANTSYNANATLNQENESYNNSYLYDEGMIENNKDNINFLLGSYKGLSKLQEDNIAKINAEKDALNEKDEAASKVALNTIQGYEDQNEVLNSNLADIHTYLDEYRSGLDDLVTAYEQKEQLGSYISSDDTAKYNEAIALIRIIDELLINASNNADDAQTSISLAVSEIERFKLSTSTKGEALSFVNGLKDGFDDLAKVYNSIATDGALDMSLLNEDFSSIFSGAVAYEDFISTITKSPKDIKQCQEAFDSLIYSWLNSEDIMSILNDETIDLVGAFLEEQGVVNATAWLTDELAARKLYASRATEGFTIATAEEITQLAGEQAEAEGVRAALARMVLAKLTCNGTTIDTSGDIQNLYNLAVQAHVAEEALASLEQLKSVSADYEVDPDNAIVAARHQMLVNKALKGVNEALYSPDTGTTTNGGITNASSYIAPDDSKSSSSSSSKNPKQEEIDWIARRKELLEQLHQVQQEIADDETATYSERLSALDSLIEKDRERAQVAQEAASRYEQAWLEASANLTEEDKDYVKYGGNDIKKYDAQELADKGIVDSVEAGEKYIENLKKAIEYRDLMTESQREELANRKEMILHEKTKIDLLKIELDLQQDLNGAITDQINSQMELLEAEGKYVNESYYKDLLQQSKESQSIAEDKLDVLYDELDAAKEAGEEYDGILVEIEQCKNEIVQCQVEQAELNDTIKRLPIERLQMFRDLYAQIVEDMDNYMSIQSSMGLNPTKEELQQYIDLYNEQIDSALEQQDKLKDLLEDYEYGSEKFNNTSKEIQDLDNEISSLIASQNEYNHQILQIPINEMAEQVDKLGQAKEALNNSIAEDNANGFKTTVQQYKDLHSITLQQLNVLAKQKSALTEMLSVYDEESDYYKEIEEQIVSIDSEMSGLVQETYQWNQELLNLPIENLSRVNENLNNYSSILDGVMSQYDSALTGVNTLVDKQIDGLQTQLDLLDETNEARQIQLGIEQSLYNLRRAEEQRNIKVIRDGKEVYESDADALRSANQSYEDALLEKQKYDIGQQIESLEEIKDKWQEIIDKIQEAKDLQAAEDLFGSGWQDSVLSDTSDLRDLFQNLYESTSNQKEAVDKEIESNERISQMMNEFVTRYQEGSVTYEQALSGINELIGAMDDGYTALENLSGMMDLDNIGSLSDIASSTQQSIANSADLLSKYMSIVESNRESVEGFETNWPNMAESIDATINSFNNAVNSIDSYIDVFNTNADAINANNKTWDEMKDMIADQIEALKKAAEELEKLSKQSSSKPSSSSSSSSRSDDGDGTYYRINGQRYHESEGSAAELITKHGTQEEQDSYWKYRENLITNNKNASDEGWKEAALKALEEEKSALKAHTGIFKGAIGQGSTQLDKILQDMAIINDDEHVRILQKGERVYTPDQILNTIDNAQRMSLPKAENLLSYLTSNPFAQTTSIDTAKVTDLIETGNKTIIPPNKQSIQNSVNVEFSGGITVNEVQNGEEFAHNLFTQISPVMEQKFSKLF